jgi:rhodanese-related sulfurtransferase
MGSKMKRLLLFAVTALLLLPACTSGGQVMDGDGMLNTYRQISQDEAKEMMLRDDGHVILDVRRQDEYDAGHIPGAILIPNESIDATPPAELPDFDQIILIYCRSGNRSKQAAQKLFDMGYTNIYEFGGINTWTGEIVEGSAMEQQTVWFLNGVKDADVWILPQTESNLKTTVWGTATASKVQTGERRETSLCAPGDGGYYMLRMIDAEHFYYSANSITLKAGWTLEIKGDDLHSVTLEVSDENGALVSTYEVFAARL